MDNKQKVSISIYIITFIVIYYISWLFWVIDFVVFLAFYSIVFYYIKAIIEKIRWNHFPIFNYENYNKFLYIFLNKIARLIILFVIILWWFAFYQNQINPAKMPVYQITNWEKNITFISMSHIWTPNFYQKVKDTIINFKKAWYVYYFEWVKPWSDENTDKFNNALGIQFDKKTYESMSKLYWLTNQDNSIFLWLVNDKDYNVDVWIDEIMDLYEKSNIINTNSWLTSNPVDVSELVDESLKWLNEKELKILRYINKSFINLIIKSDNIQSTISSEFANQKLFDVILNKRNEVLKEKILNSEDKNIIITYWMLHFDGLFNELVKSDIRWRIKKIDYISPLK